MQLLLFLALMAYCLTQDLRVFIDFNITLFVIARSIVYRDVLFAE